MTFVCVPRAIAGPGEVAAALEEAAGHRAAGASLVEWRVEALAARGVEGGAIVRRLVAESPLPCIVTARAPEEGGAAETTEDERAGLLAALADAAMLPRYADVELATFAGRGPMRAAALRLREAGTGLILSTHDFVERPRDLLQRIAAMAHEPACDVIKVAFTARSLRDAVEALELLRDRPKPMIALAMGPFGMASRLLAPKFGGLLTFVAASDADATAPGQPTLDDWVETFRADRIGRATKVHGIVGWPVAHSLSPLLHNAGFAAAHEDRCYVPLPVAPGWEPFTATLGTLLAAPGFDLAGASVTIPHKEHLVRFVREAGGAVEPLAAAIGAANTLVVGADGALACSNTDAPAIADALGGAEALRERRVLVLGAGGAARAAAAGCAAAGATVVVCGRTSARVLAMVEDLSAAPAEAFGDAAAPGRIVAARDDAWAKGFRCDDADAADPCFEVVINATPIGMEGGPDPEGSPLPAGVPLDARVTVFDTVYAPIETPLVRTARAAGARVVTGDAMFVRQAARQFEAWTGRPLPPEAFTLLFGG